MERYYHFDGLGDAHQIGWDGANFVLVSTSTNSVVWFGRSGDKTAEWKAPGDGDCWHVNGIFITDEEVYLSAFGRFTEHRAGLAARKMAAGSYSASILART
jgi:hypothetical protein